MPQPHRTVFWNHCGCKTGAALLVAVLGLSGCAAARSTEDPPAAPAAPEAATETAEETASGPDTMQLTTLAQEKVTGGWGEEIRRLVDDPAIWESTWGELWPAGPPPAQSATPPEVDFDTSRVLVVAMSTQHCDARVTVRAIEIVDGEMVVDLLEEPPHPGIRCFAATRPFHAVAFERPDAEWSGEPRFEVETRTYVMGERTES